MDLEVYITSGILELYVLDLLNQEESAEVMRMLHEFPVLRKEVEEIELALQHYAFAQAIEPPKALQAKITSSIARTALETEIEHLALISNQSDYRSWLKLVSKHFPGAFELEEYKQVLREEKNLSQVLVVTSTDIDDESHDQVHESFLILKGHCKCTVGGEVFHLNPGGFTKIPLNVPHRVEITSAEPVMAIAQYVSV